MAYSTRSLALSLTTLVCLACPTGARAQTEAKPDPPPEQAPLSGTDRDLRNSHWTHGLSLLEPFAEGIVDLRRLPSWQNVTWLAAGLGAVAAAHPADTKVSDEFSSARTRSFKPGAVVGGTPLELGAAFAAYAIGRATDKPRVVAVGHDLIRAQIVAELVTTGIKQSVRRTRPDGSSFSFPSGHTAVTFASATVLERHFGWKVGIPAYAVASYVAASRVQMKRHYLSDVAFGAVIGVVSGRTVTVGGRHRLLLTPTANLEGGGITFTWLGRGPMR